MPSKHRLSVFLLASVIIFSAQESHAFLKFIHKLSGPGNFLGTNYYCKLDFDDMSGLCKEHGGVIFFQSGELNSRAWLRLDATGLGTVGNDVPDERPVYWFSLDPTIEMSLLKPCKGNLKLFVAFGPSFNLFVGDAFRRFTKTALKLSPLTMVVKNVGGGWDLKIAAELRYFRFNSNDFGGTTNLVGGEWTKGIFLSFVRP